MLKRKIDVLLYIWLGSIIHTIRILNAMKKEKATKKEKVRCVFCNSVSHKMDNCNSTFNGRRELLDSGWCFLMDSNRPKFEILAANELRYIAYHYAAYEGAVHDWDEKNTQHYNRKFRFRPVDLTLSKTQLIKELARRWEGFQHVRDLSENKPVPTPVPTEDDDCPICLDCIETKYMFVLTISSWKKVEDKVTTECKHSFCKKCWTTHIERNSKCTNGNHTCVSCPLCCHQIKVV